MHDAPERPLHCEISVPSESGAGRVWTAGIKKRVSPYTLRHSFATHLLEQSVDIRVIQTLLGHVKLDTTARYTQIATKVICDVVSPLDRLVREITRHEPPA